MPKLRVALAQVNPTVGDLAGNAGIVRTASRAAADAGAHLVAFPEMMLTGYPVEDLVFRPSFVDASKAALWSLASTLDADGLGGLAVLVGYLDADGPAAVSSDFTPGQGPRNALAVLHGGSVVATYFKHHLPNYGVFDEDRYFVPGTSLTVVRIGGVDVALTICEDMWQAGGPFAAARRAGVGLVVTVNGSPYELDKDDVRLPLVQRRAAEAGATVAYVNMVGGQDELVFDGDSMIVTAAGELLARAPQFAEELLIHDLDLPAGLLPPPPSVAGSSDDGMGIERVAVSASAASVGRFCFAGLRRASDRRGRGVGGAGAGAARLRPQERLPVGGARPLRRDRLVGGRGARGRRARPVLGDRRLDAFAALVGPLPRRRGRAGQAHRPGLPGGADPADGRHVPGVDVAVRPGGGEPPGAGARRHPHGTVQPGGSARPDHRQQERAGGGLLDAVRRLGGRLQPAEGRAEDAGVEAGPMAQRSTRSRRGQEPPIPESSITKPPSAELRPGQLDTDSLPDYDELDAILVAYVDGDRGRDDLVAAGHDPAMVDKVLRMVDLAEYKRRQSAPGTKISIKAFGRDRRLPITNRWREHGVASS